MTKYTHKSRYFFGNEISEYGLKNGYVDYRTLAKAFDAVLCNDVTKLFYAQINSEWGEPEQANGYIDNSEEIDELQDRIDELMDEYRETDNTDRENAIGKEIDELQERIEELEREQDEAPEIFQYFIISDNGAEILKQYTNEIVYYLPLLDIYIWGVTHWGTSWDYVLTDIAIDTEEEA